MSVTYLKPQCLPLVCGIKSFKAHHELAVPHPDLCLTGLILRVSSQSDLLIYARTSCEYPHPQHLSVPFFSWANSLLANACWVLSLTSSVLCSNAMSWERPFLNIFSQIPPNSCSISLPIFIFFLSHIYLNMLPIGYLHCYDLPPILRR